LVQLITEIDNFNVDIFKLNLENLVNIENLVNKLMPKVSL